MNQFDPSSSAPAPLVAVIGGGPAGLMAAERLAMGGVRVALFDAMPSVGRKLLLAGIGGLNLTHNEGADAFLARYGKRREAIAPLLRAFGADALRAWAAQLGVETFVGSSGRVFPTGMKAAPLLRAWLQRLRAQGVEFHVRHRWVGWETSGGLRFTAPEGERVVHADAVVLALGGGSWAKLGSDGAWVPLLAARRIEVAPLRPANCGFDVLTLDAGAVRQGWSEHFRSRFAGQPLKSVVASFTDADGVAHQRPGECVITATGVEGSLIYALSAPLRDTLEAQGEVVLHLDLAPGRSLERLTADLARPRGSRSLASHLQGQAGISGTKAGLLREYCGPAELADPVRLARAIKALPLRLGAPRPLDEAISSAGGVVFEALDAHLMVRAIPGLFCAGEMLDWEAPTGGYLLTACFASGFVAGNGVLAWLAARGLSPRQTPVPR